MKIYKIENKINGNIYIGQTKKDVNDRIAKHLKNNSFIGRALRKYDLQSFIISIIDAADTKEILDEKERYWIRFYNCKEPNGYNLTDGGEGLTNPSEETRRKMGISQRMKKPISEETRTRLSAASKGKLKSEEHKQKMRKPNSKETRLNIKKALAKPEIKRKHSAALMGNKNALGKRHSMV